MFGNGSVTCGWTELRSGSSQPASQEAFSAAELIDTARDRRQPPITDLKPSVRPATMWDFAARWMPVRANGEGSIIDSQTLAVFDPSTATHHASGITFPLLIPTPFINLQQPV